MEKALLLLSLLCAVACSTVPGTGRSQLNFMSSAQEMSLGAQSYREILKSERVIKQGTDP